MPDAPSASANMPRVMIAAPSSSSGKTTVVLALLSALKAAGDNPVAFKCGPDYIDPMFHTRVLGIPSYNLDLYLSGRATVCSLFSAHAAGHGMAVTEGVMGYYDGAGMEGRASSYDLAGTLDMPVVLVVSARGASLSLAAVIQGFARFREPSHIAGAILNNCSEKLFLALKDGIEAETGIPLLGYLPNMPEATIGSRHLGLVTAAEIDDLHARLDALGRQAAQSIDLDALRRIAGAAPALEAEPFSLAPVTDAHPRIGVASDRAFCFYYADNLLCLEQCGAELVEFSPLEDAKLPEGISGMYLGGGYPELYEEQLSGNASMLASIRQAIEGGMPTFAECGGFMYLLQALDGHPMAGVLEGTAKNTGHLQRFGYCMLESGGDNLLCSAGDCVPAHEFHYWDSTACGDAFVARKEDGRTWECIQARGSLFAGFPHLYFAGSPQMPANFVKAAASYAAGGAVQPAGSNPAACAASPAGNSPAVSAEAGA